MRLLLGKLFYVGLMLMIIAIISFIAIHAAPNSFFASGELNPNITKESIEHLKAIYGLDKPLYAQFFSWIWAILHLDFGISFASGKAVKEEILSRIPITLIINLISMVLVFLLSLWLGIKAAMRQDSMFDRMLKRFSLVSYAVPSFYLALLLIIFFPSNSAGFPSPDSIRSSPKRGSGSFWMKHGIWCCRSLWSFSEGWGVC